MVRCSVLGCKCNGGQNVPNLSIHSAGESGSSSTEEDLRQSVMNRMDDDLHLHSDRPEYERQCDSLQLPDEYIPGIQEAPMYPKLSTLTETEHWAGLKVIHDSHECQPRDFNVPDSLCGPDHYETFTKVMCKYVTEMNDYRAWAKNVWLNGDFNRTFNLHPLLEEVYNAHFLLWKNEHRYLTKECEILAEVSLEPQEDTYEFKFIEALKDVITTELPAANIPTYINQDISLIKPYYYEAYIPCRRHPLYFVLPQEDNLTNLRPHQVNRQLAQFALQNRANFLASEKALQSILETQLTWKLPVSVEAVPCPETGRMKTVVVIGTGFHLQKECGKQRSFEAFRRLLLKKFTSPTASARFTPNNAPDLPGDNTSRDSDCLVIDEDYDPVRRTPPYGYSKYGEKGIPPRSFKKWQLKSADTSFDIIIHSSHKCCIKQRKIQVILEPIVEWQPELGASGQSPGRARALWLALMMRPEAELVNVRVDYKTGNIIVIDTVTKEMWKKYEGDTTEEIAGRIHGVLERLSVLNPGKYVLVHDAGQAHAMICKQVPPAAFDETKRRISLRPDSENLSAEKEVALAKSHYIILSRALLPNHKYHGILPLAFPFNSQFVEQTQETPPAPFAPDSQ